MKYIIIPIIKFISAIILTLTLVPIHYFIVVIGQIWELEFNKKDFRYKFGREDIINISPYYNPQWRYTIDSYLDFHIFKSMFHYIWNLK